MIEIRHLTKKYGENVAVNDLNLTLEPGNIYGFLGPNGAGKSTTMNIITGYIGATAGEVLINGHDINKEPEAAKQCIGYLPEMPPVYGDMKVMEYLKFVAELKQLNPHTRFADIKQVMDLTKLEPVQNRLIRNLSKGYRQRVGLAQALMGLPEIVILDEPTVGLDPKQIIEIRDLIKSLRTGHTVILSSHILQEISAVCDHVFIISHGNLVASDSMEHLEEKMSGAQQLRVTVSGDKKAISAMGRIHGVKSFEILESKNNDAVEKPKQLSKKATGSNPKNPEGKADASAAELHREGADGRKNAETIADTADGKQMSEAVAKAEKSLVESSETIQNPNAVTETAVAAQNPDVVTKTAYAEQNQEIVTETEVLQNADVAFTVDVQQEKGTAPTERTEKMESNKATEKKPNEIQLELNAKPGADLRASVFRYCVDHELTLLEMTTIMKSLEDVFLELTDGREVQ